MKTAYGVKREQERRATVRRYNEMVRKQRNERIARAQAEAGAALAANKCPQCGGGVRRNLALTGWVQCEQFGAVGFRKDASKPACSWQGFVS